MHRNPLVEGTAGQQVVDPPGVLALEGVGRRHSPELGLQSTEVNGQVIDQVGLDSVGDDGVAVLGDASEVGAQPLGWGGRQSSHDRESYYRAARRSLARRSPKSRIPHRV